MLSKSLSHLEKGGEDDAADDDEDENDDGFRHKPGGNDADDTSGADIDGARLTAVPYPGAVRRQPLG